VGNPVLIPEWALGWHQSKFGYKDTSSLQENVNMYANFELPLDAQWVDMDYMHEYEDFTIDPTRFADLPSFVKNISDKGIHFVPIIDAGIA
jgi:alpha-glucosidase